MIRPDIVAGPMLRQVRPSIDGPAGVLSAPAARAGLAAPARPVARACAASEARGAGSARSRPRMAPAQERTAGMGMVARGGAIGRR
ncbi:MAG: hypothetical protein U5K74_11655 [Gemmatimonadaceae bacterium]|nr:hypothetical protein [Gemmatimonadaceae bacterium]